MNKENLARSIANRLSNISKEKNIAYRYVAMSFFIERMVARILTSPLKDDLIFKGGYVGLRVYDSKRYTVDLDAVLNSNQSKENLDSLQKAIESDLDDGVWFKFEGQEKLPLQSYRGGIKLIYRAGLGEPPKNVSKAVKVHFDIGFSDAIIPDPVLQKTSTIFGDGEISWRVYPVETMIAEKVHAFIFRDGGSSRAKDLYDLSFYLPKADQKNLEKAIKACFNHRETDLPESVYETMKSYDFFLVKKSWNKVSSVISEKTDFESCLDIVLQNLKNLKL